MKPWEYNSQPQAKTAGRGPWNYATETEPDKPTSWKEALTPSLDSVREFARGAAVDTVEGLASSALHPVDTITNLIKAQIAEPGKARDAYRDGRYSEAAGHALAALVPVLGPQAASIGEQIGETGNIARGLGQAAALIVPATSEGRAAASRVGNAAGDAASRVARPIARVARDVINDVPGARDTAIGSARAAAGVGGVATMHPVAAAIGAQQAASGAAQAMRGRSAAARYNQGPKPVARSAPATITASVPSPIPPVAYPAPRPFAERIPSMPVGEDSLPSAVAARAEDFAPSAEPLPPDRFKDSPEFEAGYREMLARRKKPPSGESEARTSAPYRPDKPRADEAARAFKAAMEEDAVPHGTVEPDTITSDDAQAEMIRRMVQPQDTAEIMRDLSPQMRTEAAKSNYRAVKEGNAEPETAAPVFKEAARATKADALAQYMIENGIGSEKAARMNVKAWAEHASKAGVNPPSMATIAEAVFKMRKQKK